MKILDANKRIYNEDRPSIYFFWGRREKHAVLDLNLPGYFWFLINILLFQALAIEYIKTIAWVQIVSRLNPVRSGNVSENEKNALPSLTVNFLLISASARHRLVRWRATSRCKIVLIQPCMQHIMGNSMRSH